LKAERQVCKVMLTLLPKEVRNVDPACHSDAMDCTICALVVQAGVGTRPGPDSRSAAGARQTDCDGSVASARARAGAALSEVSPGAESGAVVECRRGPCVIGSSGGDVRCNGASRDWDRRYLGAATRREDQSQGDLSGSRALFALTYGESQWAALALCNGVSEDSLGGPGMGVTVSHRLMPLRAVSPPAGTAG